MRYLLFTAAGLAMLTGLAVAQEQPPAPPPAPMAAGQPDDGAPPPPPPGHGKHGERGPRGGRDGDRPPPPSKAAHIRLEKGDLKLDVKCADDEPMKACSDIALQLLDKVAARP